jgi:hypothetical protein
VIDPTEAFIFQVYKDGSFRFPPTVDAKSDDRFTKTGSGQT